MNAPQVRSYCNSDDSPFPEKRPPFFRLLLSWPLVPWFLFRRLPFLSPFKRLASAFFGNFLLIFFPVPLGFIRTCMVGYFSRNGDMVFYSHPRFVLCMHLIWTGWLVALLTGLNAGFAALGFGLHLPVAWATWLWLVVILMTLVAMGLDLGRVATGFALAAVVILLLSTLLLQGLTRVPLLGMLASCLIAIPMSIDWGVPAFTSLVLGVLFAMNAAWRRLNDVWTISCHSNYLEHYSFESRDNSIPQGAKSFSAYWPCLFKKYFFCGWGDIRVLDFYNRNEICVIRGVLFAHWHVKVLMRRLADVKVDPVDHACQASLEEVAAASAVDLSPG